jgi:hypothetical protein
VIATLRKLDYSVKYSTWNWSSWKSMNPSTKMFLPLETTLRRFLLTVVTSHSIQHESIPDGILHMAFWLIWQKTDWSIVHKAFNLECKGETKESNQFMHLSEIRS